MEHTGDVMSVAGLMKLFLVCLKDQLIVEVIFYSDLYLNFVNRSLHSNTNPVQCAKKTEPLKEIVMYFLHVLCHFE